MGNQWSGNGYNVDIVMCIDATGSMAPIINQVKNNALTFHEKFQEKMEIEGKGIGALRIKVIVFKDYICDTEPMKESRFFELPGENEEFRDFVNRIEPTGGGDTPENALEAIALALKSDWTTAPGKKRHVVLVFTDAPALPLQERKGCPNYPIDMPKDLAELGDWWEGYSQTFYGNYSVKAGRLVVFAPNAEPWTQLEGWSRYWYQPSSAGKGLTDVEMDEVFALLTGTM